MTSPSRPSFESSRRRLLCAVLLATSIGASAADWRRALVQAVSVASAVDAAIDADCASKAAAADGRVAVVSYRVGKSSYVRAVPVPAGEDFAVHEEVLVDPGACRIAHLPKAASQP